MQDDPKAPPLRVEVSSDELIEAYSGPAPGANKFFVSIGQPGVRITFAETNPSVPGRAFFRNAVTLHPLDAISLYRVLQDMLKDIETDFKNSGVALPEASKDGE